VLNRWSTVIGSVQCAFKMCIISNNCCLAFFPRLFFLLNHHVLGIIFLTSHLMKMFFITLDFFFAVFLFIFIFIIMNANVSRLAGMKWSVSFSVFSWIILESLMNNNIDTIYFWIMIIMLSSKIITTGSEMGWIRWASTREKEKCRLNEE
jgi:hypothetical protein